MRCYLNSKCIATGLTPSWLTYGYDVVLPLEIMVKSLRVAKKNDLELVDYHKALIMELDLTNGDRLMALENIWLNKLKVA